ncbi:helix-turn-helix transcriptional regulator [Xanthomonas oryzae pv. oryzicola]|uniref:helix-turn-helix transcriptional regulator n=1 Tax=Xanthomonas oryzae TaxID=347 RepID=UPI0006432D3E|nr:helix-turn-helix transcriptional regulator [Xanthomonas oryzae]AKK62533.1 XRE family transcriptional regulator [Xanthomonas oryzae pv. oryzicola]AKO02321.1 XRE family transcriptional regulator [Xanthomonas oryzae pv. oryzicola]KOR46723.1 XRE family transcriptional regulator [Xanthomonas oryzae]OLK91065.1 XRE family transcriptional regulator [Xanthomonas oryzae pv. oryzicola]QEO99697.1 XRE family transcriptional regulator [Xanthomonas oryzae pv. oryzicola]
MDTVRTPSDVGNIIRARRKRLGWDQARLAHEIGVSRQWIVDIEKGKPRAELQLILRALQALGLELILSSDIAQIPPANAPERGTVTLIDLDAIIEHNRSNSRLGTTVLNAFNNNIFKNQFSSLDRLKNADLHRPFSAVDALEQSPVQAASAVDLNRYSSMIDAPNERNLVSEPLQKQFPALDRPTIGETTKISKVISKPSKKKADP